MSNFKQKLVKALKPYNQCFGDLNPTVLKAALQLSQEYIQTGNVAEEKVDRAVKVTDCQQNFHEILAAIILIITQYLRIQAGLVKNHEVLEALTDSKIDSDSAKEIIRCLADLRQEKLIPFRTFRESFKSIEWRINISAFDSKNLASMKQTTILIRLNLKSGKVFTMVVPLKMFHQLRHKVATLLREMQKLESRSVMKK